MTSRSQPSGATLDELNARLQDIEAALRALNSDAAGSAQFKTAKAALELLHQSCAGMDHWALVFKDGDETKCMALLERHVAVWRLIIASPLRWPFTEAPNAKPTNRNVGKPSRGTRPNNF